VSLTEKVSKLVAQRGRQRACYDMATFNEPMSVTIARAFGEKPAIGRKYILGIDLGTSLGSCRLFLDGGIDAQTHKLETTIGGRTVGVGRLIKRHEHPDCLGASLKGSRGQPPTWRS
jgi:hypothetical protein